MRQGDKLSVEMSYASSYKKTDAADAAPLLDNSSAGTYNTNNENSFDAHREANSTGSPPGLLRNKACTLLAAFGTCTLTFVAIYVLADTEGRYIILEKGDSRDKRTMKAVQIILAALVYLAIGVYNYKKWKMKEVGGDACGDSGSYLPLS